MGRQERVNDVIPWDNTIREFFFLHMYFDRVAKFVGTICGEKGTRVEQTAKNLQI